MERHLLGRPETLTGFTVRREGRARPLRFDVARQEVPPETVFGFFTDSELITRWLANEATLDPRPGGANHQIHVAIAGASEAEVRRLLAGLSDGATYSIEAPH